MRIEYLTIFFIAGLILGTYLYQVQKRIKKLEAERLELIKRICQSKNKGVYSDDL